MQIRVNFHSGPIKIGTRWRYRIESRRIVSIISIVDYMYMVPVMIAR